MKEEELSIFRHFPEKVEPNGARNSGTQTTQSDRSTKLHQRRIPIANSSSLPLILCSHTTLTNLKKIIQFSRCEFQSESISGKKN